MRISSNKAGAARVFVLVGALFLSALLSLACQAATPDFLERQNLEPELSHAKQAIKQRDWKTAKPYLDKLLVANPDNADLLTLSAFVCRKSRDLDCAFAKYKKALQLEPGNLKALEYLGEAYLQAGQPKSAQIQLDLIEKFCSRQCEEWEDLDHEIHLFNKKHPGK